MKGGPVKTRLAAAVVLSVAALTASCGQESVDSGLFVMPRAGDRGLPSPAPRDPTKKPIAAGTISFRPLDGPLVISVDSNFNVRFSAVAAVPTLIGAVSFNGGVVVDRLGNELSKPPSGVTQLVFCQRREVVGVDDSTLSCSAYSLAVGGKLSVATNGKATTIVERTPIESRITVVVEPGTEVTLDEANPPPELPKPYDTARVDIQEIDYRETGQATDVDLESNEGGRAADIRYNHKTGELSLLNGANIAKLSKHRQVDRSWFPPRGQGLDFGDLVPSELECDQQSKDSWKGSFGPDDLTADAIIACIRTAERDLGYLVIGRNRNARPTAYQIFSKIWVR